jgi:DNA polymerase/3'-5' exonuclease PolX
VRLELLSKYPCLDFSRLRVYSELMANVLRDLSVAQLKRAAAIKGRIDNLERQLTGILGIPETLTVGGVIRRRRRMSAAVRKKIAAAARARWARVRAGRK